MNIYHCKHCDKFVERDSDKAWIKSYCDVTGQYTRLVRLDRADLSHLDRELDSQHDSTEGDQ